ncbi:hypothetical protein BBK36DRAFT_1155057 [Trichoderma citrinoviride]|uniref:Uncharacterized protein n=1 Tax=Trichoderma citrinoviride TaxID=58853 RepID=A0A2T4BLT6_9HYPO|nr:hypothetical protein BBK36DRAFT_1155057 [Trichoderma citrinoviride]PTB70241.1 hypothetical protein BBK36DRAFT_1155057 [Trichoderma citrinoviride]
MSGSDVDADRTKNDALPPSSNGSGVVKKRKKDRKPVITMEDSDSSYFPRASDGHGGCGEDVLYTDAIRISGAANNVRVTSWEAAEADEGRRLRRTGVCFV